MQEATSVFRSRSHHVTAFLAVAALVAAVVSGCGTDDDGGNESMVFYIVDTLSIDSNAKKVPLADAVQQAQDLVGYTFELPSQPVDGYEPEAVLVAKAIPDSPSRAVRIHYAKGAGTSSTERMTLQVVGARNVQIAEAEVAVAEPRGIEVMFNTSDSGSITFVADGVGYILVDVDPALPREAILKMIGSLEKVIG